MVSRRKDVRKVELTCRSKKGCRRLAVAVLNQHYDEKKRKQAIVEKLSKKSFLTPKDKSRLTYVSRELEMLEYFERSELYSLYFGFIEDIIDKEKAPEYMKVNFV